MRRRSLALSSAALLAACSGQIGAPSLAPRPIEGEPIELPTATREVATPLDPALAERVDAALAAATAGQRAFEASRVATEAAVARAAGAPPGSEAWTVAQQALSSLVVARGPVHDAAAELDTLRQRPDAGGTANRARIDEAAQTIDALDTAQAATVDALQKRLR